MESTETKMTESTVVTTQETDVNINEWKYLIFRLGGEFYGTPLLSVKEVVKFTTIKQVPYTVPHYRGIISLRGSIIGIIDLRLKFGLESQENKYGGCILIVESDEMTIGALVDDVDSVVTLDSDQVDVSPTIETKIDPRFLLGVAKHEDELINLIDIVGTLSNEDIKVLRRH